MSQHIPSTLSDSSDSSGAPQNLPRRGFLGQAGAGLAGLAATAAAPALLTALPAAAQGSATAADAYDEHFRQRASALRTGLAKANAELHPAAPHQWR